MIQKQGNWELYELKSKDVERRFFTCEQLIQRQQRKGFLHRIMTGDEKWIFYDNPKKKKYYARSIVAMSISTSTQRPNIHDLKNSCSVSGRIKRVLFTRSCWNLAIPLRTIGIDNNWFVWAVHCEKNSRNSSKNMIKLFFFMTTLGLMSLSKKNIWKRSNGMFYRTRYILRTLLLLITVPKDAVSPVHFFRRNRKLAPKLDRLQRRVIFSRWNSKIAWEMGKSSRQRWTIL